MSHVHVSSRSNLEVKTEHDCYFPFVLMFAPVPTPHWILLRPANPGMYRSQVPSGASTGIYEAVELRDKGKAYMGKGEHSA